MRFLCHGVISVFKSVMLFEREIGPCCCPRLDLLLFKYKAQSQIGVVIMQVHG